ncbi:MAG: hypothetical protein AAFQ19_04380 [Pseudomonadota bacterium]
MTQAQSTALKIAAGLWVIWGLVHALAGLLTIAQDTGAAASGIADAVDPALFALDYPAAMGGLINQHGWNLFWGGAVTVVGAAFIWRGSLTAIWVTAMVGGLLDIGYFVFMDLPGYVNFMPGTVMTLVSSTTILLSGWVWVRQRKP